MAYIKYYPLSRVQTGLNTRGNIYALDGEPYTGPYYLTYDGKAFTGINPTIGGNDLLIPLGSVGGARQTASSTVNAYNRTIVNNKTKSLDKAFQPTTTTVAGNLKQVTPYYPLILEEDYSRGYFMRYFAKRIADKGYIMEVTRENWNLIKGGLDPTYMDYEVEDMMWQLTGPLKDTRVSQYQVKGGIETTNKRITEQKAKTFIGLVEFIGGDYTKFARITK